MHGERAMFRNKLSIWQSRIRGTRLHRRLAVAALALFAPLICQAQAQDLFGADESTPLLSPDQAFSARVDSVSDSSIGFIIDIADGYYLYKKSLDVAAESQGFDIQLAGLPTGETVEDAYFGKSEIYRTSVAFKASYQNEQQSSTAELVLKSQGCADIGVCYPPHETRLQAALPEATAAVNARTEQAAGSMLDGLLAQSRGISDLLGDSQPELLPPDVAFLPSADVDGNTVIITFAIEPGYYMYNDKFAVQFADPAAATIKSFTTSTGKMKEDAYFGLVEVHRDTATLTLELASSRAGETQLLLEHQGCADVGVCYPPQQTTLPLTLASYGENSPTVSNVSTSTPVTGQIQSSPSATGTAAANTLNLSEQDRLAKTLATSSLWLIAAIFFGLGLLLSFTPCVFPMIPILSSIIVGQGQALSTGRAFTLSVVYVLAMAVTYTIAGIVVGLSGENIQIWFQNPWVLSAFALLFVLLSLSMFGFYELQMPAFIQNRLNSLSNQQQGGTLAGVGIMGALSALIVGPCVTAPLVGALIFIADTGNALVGGVALFFLGLGMGAPLVAIGASYGKWLPRAGAWMETTKAVFGVLMLAMAIWMLSRFIPASATLALAAALAIVSGIYLGALDTINSEASGWRRLFKGAGLVSMVYGVILLIGAASGGNDLLQPLSRFGSFAASGETQQHDGELEFNRVKTIAELQQVVATAKANNQSVMLDFYADWCISCKEMERFTFTDENVQQKLADVILVQADVTKNDAEDKALLKHFGLFGPPAIIFYTPEQDEIRNARVVGFMSASDFTAHLERFL